MGTRRRAVKVRVIIVLEVNHMGSCWLRAVLSLEEVVSVPVLGCFAPRVFCRSEEISWRGVRKLEVSLGVVGVHFQRRSWVVEGGHV